MHAILTRGDPRLEQPSRAVEWPDPRLHEDIVALGAALDTFRREQGFGRAISAPQLGIAKRIIQVNLGATPFAVINPAITWRSTDTFTVWDDCLSVPDCIVQVERHCSISLDYVDEYGRPRRWENLPPDLSELLQHEIDHLDGVLMTARAIDEASIRPIEERAGLIDVARPVHRLSLDAIAEAARIIDPVFLHSPQFDCEPLSEALGCELTVKLETTNPIRSFKGRGVDYFLSRMVANGDERELVCASAGNFGQAMAYVCRKHDRALRVYASEHASALKVERMRELGAAVHLQGNDFDAAKAAARRYGEAHGAWMVEDGREAEISEGAGSVAVELLERGDVYDSVVAPLGNGALLNGIARWFKAASPATRVVGVCARGADAMEKSWRGGAIVEPASVDTIADGIAVRLPVAEAVEDMRGVVDEVLLVDDGEILAAMRLLFERAGLLIEPAGAAGVAGILANTATFSGQRVATVLCGSNLAPATFLEWLSNAE